jgi:hypothetical protein
MSWSSSAEFPQALASISRYSSDESQLRDEADEDELDAPMNGRRMDVMIEIRRTSLAVQMNSPAKESKPE